jgi:SAM-dependent methyltransferase
MYDTGFARATLASPAYAKIARDEVRFIFKASAVHAGERLLDVPCGTGRHARLFAERGLEVTGLDLSADCLAIARKTEPKTKVRYAKADMADLGKYRGKFDAVVNLFTSFGYFAADAKNEAVLREMVACLRPGGRIVLSLIDRDWLLGHFVANSWSERDGVFTLEARKYDAKTRYIEAQTILLNRKDSRAEAYYHRTRLYSKTEMVALLRRAGLGRIQVFGNTDGSLFRKGESSHPIYVAWKK